MLIKIIGAIAAIVVIAVIIAAVAMWRGLIPVPSPLLALLVGAKEPEYSAQFYPPDTLTYAWFTLTPAGGQFDEMRDIWGRFNEYPAFEELVAELKEDFTDETDIDFDTEVAPWIGPEISGGVLAFDVAQEELTAAAIIGVRDADVAADFLSKWLEYMTDTAETDFDAGSHRGFDTWVDEDKHQAYALTDDWLVYATDESVLEDTLDRIDGDGGRSLADTENFMAARAALPEHRFNSSYVDYRRALVSWEDFALGGLGFPGVGGLGAFENQTPEWIAISAAWVERGVVMEIVSPTATDFGLEVGDLDDPARLLSDDTLGFMAAAFDPAVDRWRAALREYKIVDVLPYPEMLDEINDGLSGISPRELADNATLADALDLGFGLAQDFTGIDLEADLFDHLAGEAILAASEFDFDAMEDDPANNPVDAVAMLSYREDGKDGLQDTMDDVTGLIEMYLSSFARSDTADVGANDDATVFRIDGTAYAPGYVLHDGYLTLGSTEEALAAIIERQNGAGAALSSDAEYRRALDHLAGNRQFLAYVDVNRIIRQLEPDDIGTDADHYRILAEGLGVVAMDSAGDTDYSRVTVALTLFPE